MINSKIDYLLHLADNALILAQRNAEWCGHGPVLEQDIAITNISLDLLGQSRNFYQYAAKIIKDSSKAPSHKVEGIEGEVTEDTLAYHRNEREFKNCLLVEQPNGDWGQTILRQFFFSAYQYLLYRGLQQSADTQIAAIAAKAFKEVSYHLRWSSEWVIRLGDGTPESHERMKNAIDAIWPYTGELFDTADFEFSAARNGLGVDPLSLKDEWSNTIHEVFALAGLTVPVKTFMHSGGKKGIHSEFMGFILADLQYVQRTYPGCEW